MAEQKGWTPPTPDAPKPDGIWLPAGTSQAGADKVKALINIIGASGVGKSFLVNQLCRDPDYGPDEVLVLMHEDARATYGVPLPHIRPVRHLAETIKVVEELAAAAKKGARLPKVLVEDSLTGLTDYQQQYFEAHPNMAEKRDREGNIIGESRDKRSEFGDLGRGVQTLYLLLRDQIPCDVVMLITSHEGAFSPMPEIACEGKVIPKNITRWSTCTLYMKAEAKPGNDPEEIAKYIEQYGVEPHRSYGRDANGGYDGTFISRFFITQNTGEIAAKGHKTLNIRERAILPDVLRKIHGVAKAEAK